MALIREAYPEPTKRARAVAVWAMGAAAAGVIEAGADGFSAPRVLVALASAVVALAAFLTAQVRGRTRSPRRLPVFATGNITNNALLALFAKHLDGSNILEVASSWEP